MSESLRLVLRFIVLFVLQVVFLNQMAIAGLAKPFLYIFFLLFLPIKWKPWIVLIICFLTGALMDIFSNTYGLHAAACSFIGVVRPFVYRLITPQFDPDDEVLTDVYSRTLSQFVAYAGILSVLFCVFFFLFQGGKNVDFINLLLWIAVSSVLTFIVILIYRYLFVSRVRKRRLS